MNYYLNARRDALDDVGLFESVSNEERVHRFDKNLAGKIRRGDIIKYKGHISMVYSDRPTCNSKGEDCKYQIIHAYGGDKNGLYTYPDHDAANAGKKVFGRKVIKTWENISTPTGFGRIKLWD